MKRSTQGKHRGSSPFGRQAKASDTGTSRVTRQSLFWVLAALVIAIPFTMGRYLEFS